MSQPAYLIIQLNVKDFQQYLDQYGRPVFSQLSKLGGEFLVTSAEAETLEGEWFGNWTALIRFPSRETAMEWYESVDYAPLKSARIKELTTGGNMILLPGRESDSGK
jgi:uncharacterized protein (DUF1330 family)